MKNKLNVMRFQVKGITCTGCAMDMENILLDLNGVEAASLNYADGIFAIEYDSGEIKEETIIKKVKNLGFNTKLLKEQNRKSTIISTT